MQKINMKIFLFRTMEKSVLLAKIVDCSAQWTQPRPIVHLIIYFLFIRFFKVNIDEAERKKISDYKSVTDFFTRNLDTKVRPIEKKTFFCSPCDGCIVSSGITKSQTFFIKNTEYKIDELIPFLSKAEENKIIGGKYAVIYLSPKDYHRVHAPADAKLKKVIATGVGRLPVNDFSLDHLGKVFSHNRRVIFFFESKEGSFILVMIGALNVGKITLNFDENFSKIICKERKKTLEKKYTDLELKKGEELATFSLGSTVAIFCEKNLTKKFEKQRTIKQKENLESAKILLGKDLASFLSNC